MRVVVVGASSGLGRCIGVGLGQRGHEVALLARRVERLTEAAAEVAGTAHVVECDVTDEAGCRTAVAGAAEALGGIDALVYATGIGTLGRLEDLDADAWQRSFATNVTGAAIATSAALPHLRVGVGNAVFLSSISASMTPPWPGLGAYTASKAALDRMVEAWRIEHPDVGFTRVTVGDCAGGEGAAATEFTAGWDPADATDLMTSWFEQGYISGSLIDVEELVRTVAFAIDAGPSAVIPTIAILPREQRR